MISITILPAEIHGGFKHIATEYEIATDEYFENIIYDETDYIYLYTKLVNLTVETGKEYFVRARALLDSGGYTELSAIHIVTPSEAKVLTIDTPVPAKIGPPTLYFDEDVNQNEVPTKNIKINVNGFETISGVSLKAITYILTDVNGEYVDGSISNEEDLESHIFTKQLFPNKIYRISASFMGDNNNVSQFASITFITKDEITV